jgi:hypothetical protein
MPSPDREIADVEKESGAAVKKLPKIALKTTCFTLKKALFEAKMNGI